MHVWRRPDSTYKHAVRHARCGIHLGLDSDIRIARQSSRTKWLNESINTELFVCMQFHCLAKTTSRLLPTKIFRKKPKRNRKSLCSKAFRIYELGWYSYQKLQFFKLLKESQCKSSLVCNTTLNTVLFHHFFFHAQGNAEALYIHAIKRNIIIRIYLRYNRSIATTLKTSLVYTIRLLEAQPPS